MNDTKDPDLQERLAKLQDLHQEGKLSEDELKFFLEKIKSASPAPIFDQKRQTVGSQTFITKVKQKTPEPGASPETLRTNYLEGIFTDSCGLPLAGVDPKAATDEDCEGLRLTAVYIALMTQTPETEADKEGRRITRAPENRSRPLSAMAVLNRRRKLALLGDPGSEKSTFVNFVTLCMAAEALGEKAAGLAPLATPFQEIKADYQPWDHGPMLPVKVVLRDLAARGLPKIGKRATGDTLWKFIRTELGDHLKEYIPISKRSFWKKAHWFFWTAWMKCRMLTIDACR
jgi:hypothetical protein